MTEQRTCAFDEHLYAAVAGSDIGTGICIKCGEREPPPLQVICARCGKEGTNAEFYCEEGDEWECPPCWERCEAQESSAT